MGTILDSGSIMLILVPLMYPILVSLNIDLIWFGIITVIAVEVGLLTPPLGISIFVIKSSLDNDKISYLWKAPAGEFSTKNDTAFWIAPDSLGYYHISCIVNDGNGTSDGAFLKILVVQGGALIEGIVKNAVTGLVEEDIEVSLNGLESLSLSLIHI